eukprot:2292162-Rhodomonas_salina.2
MSCSVLCCATVWCYAGPRTDVWWTRPYAACGTSVSRYGYLLHDVRTGLAYAALLLLLWDLGIELGAKSDAMAAIASKEADKVSSYAPATRCPVLTCCMMLHVSARCPGVKLFVDIGTDAAYDARWSNCSWADTF